MRLEKIYDQISDDPQNDHMRELDYEPVFTAHPDAKVMIVGQAPGIRAQASQTPWNDPSGDNLRAWLDMPRDIFYDPSQVALIPMDFYFPGKGKHGDLPPRKGFAEKWHPLLLDMMPNVELILLIGIYAQKYYLGKSRKRNLTETVRSYQEYLPRYFPTIHPSPRNYFWHTKNPWFKEKVVPELRRRVKKVLA